MDLIRQIASDETLEQAYLWLCERRRNYSHNDDVWDVRLHWSEIKPILQANLLAGRYRFSPLRRIHGANEDLEIWCAMDALVLKATAIVLTEHLAPQLSRNCHHLAGNGGAKAAIRRVLENRTGNEFVFRSDVRSYYASIDHETLFSQLQERIHDEMVLDLLRQYMRRTVYDDGLYEDVDQGISLGCPLSPLMGALYLDDLDRRMENTGLFYARFMDDWVILAPTRWKLRKAIKLVKVGRSVGWARASRPRNDGTQSTFFDGETAGSASHRAADHQGLKKHSRQGGGAQAGFVGP